ncbi:MAG: PEPxxWA-CTERM sorting domain-containing protein [Novosphingobium sp.]
MKKFFALIAAAFVMSAAPAQAAATITYYVKNVGVPSYGTASIIESFTGTAGTAAFPTGTTKSIPVSTTAFTGTLTETVTQDQVNKKNGSKYAAFVTGATGTSGTALAIKGGSVTLDFGASGIQFLKFVIGNYQNSASLFVQYVGGAMGTTNLFTGSGMAPGANNYGTILMDANGGTAIQAIKLVATSNEIQIDSIAAATPEPAAWMMMIFGFGLAGAQLRRRRGAVKLATA